MEIRNEDYIHISGWMSKELGLKGSELLAYALIFGFSRDGESCFHGRAQYVADWLGTSKRTAFNILKSLTEKGFIIREEEMKNNVPFVSYKAVPLEKLHISSVVKKFHGGDEEVSRGGSEEVSSIDNTNIDSIHINSSLKENINIKEKSDKPTSSKKEEIDIKEIISEVEAEETLSLYGEREEQLIEAVSDWMDMRKAKKTPNTARAVKLNLLKACKLAYSDTDKMIRIFEQSTMNGWQGVFALPEDRESKKTSYSCYGDRPADEMYTQLPF